MVIIDAKLMLKLEDIAAQLYREQLRPNLFKIHMEALRMLLVMNGVEPNFKFEEGKKS